jgi:hypothetical protein
MVLKGEIENDSFTVKQKLTHYALGEDLQVYNLKATASKMGGQHEEVVKDIYGICFTDELQELQWFSNFESKAKYIYIMNKSFLKAYSKMHMSFPNFKDMFNRHIIKPEDMFKTLKYNNGVVDSYLLVEYDYDHEKCRFYKEHCTIEEKWIPHLEPFNHKMKMVTDEKYDIDALYLFLSSRKDVYIPNGIEVEHEIFENNIIRTLNFYVQIFKMEEADREIYEDLPTTVLDISRFELKKT